MLNLDTLRSERRDEIMRLAARRGARNVRVFGSVARGEANENSDLTYWSPGNRAEVCWTTLDASRIFRICSA
jgi:hypothetical protein